MKKIIALVLAAMMLMGICGALAETPEGYPEVPEGLDFGGQTVYIYDWWSSGDEEHSDRTADPDDETQLLYDYRDWLEATCNVKIVEKNWKGWQENPQELANKVTDKDASELCLIMIDPNFAGGPLANNLYMPWSIDLSGEQWLQSVISFMTKDGKVYGVLAGYDEPREGIFFNKKVLANAGIDYNEIYDHQADGTWTWDVFESYMDKVQQDTDNDGIYDIWALTGNGDRLLRGCVYGNKANFFDYDADGKLAITADSDACLAGIAKRQEWGDKYMASKDAIAPDGEWNWFEGFWKEGTTAFFVGQAYEGFGANALMQSCDFEWGYVAFPKGPDADDYYYAAVNNIIGIPNVYDEETSLKLQQIYALYTYPTPGVDQETAWIGNKYDFTDDRAVDETFGMLKTTGHAVANLQYLLGDENTVMGSTLYWALGSGTPAEIVEAAREAWQYRCDVFNGVAVE